MSLWNLVGSTDSYRVEVRAIDSVYRHWFPVIVVATRGLSMLFFIVVRK